MAESIRHARRRLPRLRCSCLHRRTEDEGDGARSPAFITIYEERSVRGLSASACRHHSGERVTAEMLIRHTQAADGALPPCRSAQRYGYDMMADDWQRVRCCPRMRAFYASAIAARGGRYGRRALIYQPKT